MVKITLGVEGMKCGMCEAHMNNAINEKFNVKKVESSHQKNVTVIIAKEDISEDALRATVEEQGYTMTSVKKEPYEKKGLFGLGKKK